MTDLINATVRQREKDAEREVLAVVAALGPARRRAIADRLRIVVETLGEVPASEEAALVRQVGALLADGRPDHLWLARAVLAARLPTNDQMGTLLRTARLYGPWSALLPSVRRAGTARVKVVVGRVTCDVHSTAATDFVSGIQRVVRAVAVRWRNSYDVEFLGWTDDWRSMRRLSAEDRDRVFGAAGDPPSDEVELVVPWRGTHLIPELAAEAERSARVMALARFSGNQVGVIGYDCIPMTTASSVAPGMVGLFTRYLATCREIDRIAAISDAAAAEYSGWRSMLAGVRSNGPEIRSVTLPVAAPSSHDEAMARARHTLRVTSAPMVLVVGSHEPRKNHLAVLHAAELLWREGLRFTLTIVGAGSWKADAFYSSIAELQGAGRPVQSVRGLPDDELWAGLRLAHCTLFPSLNEGFGLPVAESLAAGTPVITSNFGSTRDIVAPDGVPLGGLLVDPRDDHAIVDALRTMLTDSEAYDRMKAETADHELGTWDDYAEQVWDFLVREGHRRGSDHH